MVGGDGTMRRKLNILVLPYRDFHFKRRYGNAVRDIQMILGLGECEHVNRVTVVNRPISVYEVLLGMKKPGRREPTGGDENRVEWIDSLSWDLLGPFRGRAWFARCFEDVVEGIARKARDESCINVILDFHPIAKIDIEKIGYDFYWYDAIDNFTRHNRFSSQQRGLVKEKYSQARMNSDLITGVSEAAVAAIGDGQVVSNAVAISRRSVFPVVDISPQYDFGFIGFITDKFDVEAVRRICNFGFTCAVYGEVYDKSIGRELDAIPGVSLFGRFRDEDISGLVATFKVGLVPYIVEKMHDESPIKIFKYLHFGRPVVASSDFGMNNEFINVYDSLDGVLKSKLEGILEAAEREDYRGEVSGSISDEWFWDKKIAILAGKILDSEAEKGSERGEFT